MSIEFAPDINYNDLQTEHISYRLCNVGSAQLENYIHIHNLGLQ